MAFLRPRPSGGREVWSRWGSKQAKRKGRARPAPAPPPSRGARAWGWGWGTPALPTSCPAGRPLPQLPLPRASWPPAGAEEGPARLRQTVSWRLSNVPGATDGRWHQGHPCRNTGSHHCFPAPTRRQAHRGCDSPKSHSVLVTSVTPRSPRLSSRHPGRPQLSLKARWLSRILCALGRSLACSDLRLLESIDVSLPSPHKHLLSACCMLTLWSQSGHTATA